MTFTFLLFCIENILFLIALIPQGFLFSKTEKVNRVIQVILWVQSVFIIFTIITNLQLVTFHAWIAKRGISTYDYIGYRRKLKEKEAEVKSGQLT